MKYLRLLRVKHYIKNVLIFVPLFFSGKFFDGRRLIMTVLGCALFCLVSSAVYIVNDICDVEKDRRHPVKRNRPIAGGAVRIRTAWMLAALLFAVPLMFLCLFFPLSSAVLAVLYSVLNIAYSFGLKDKAILDICILVSGFLIRIIYGGVMSRIEVSAWLYLTVIAISFYFALGKRRNEMIRHSETETRNVLKFYTKEFLDKNMYMCVGLANGFYALWAIEQKSKYMIGTVPIVLILTMRYSLVVEGSSEGDPVEVLLGDRLIMGLGIIYVLYIAIVLYLG